MRGVFRQDGLAIAALAVCLPLLATPGSRPARQLSHRAGSALEPLAVKMLAFVVLAVL
ncbi:MAG TPA: hypothetical protein VGZ32_10115 [Actinocrinis sp.]|uniref:hypothetical protein n=1 Tax=Actinocrinis sp. TaxID=1920516 RepID=UPI002DDD1042|nr:hypothetical protein [Actinocrinis sp.]HEV3170684.1 hypothetical protein [Actinocrinis sp.]